MKFEDSTLVNKKVFYWNKFQRTYSFSDSENLSKQILGVNWYKTDSIEYQLIYVSKLCAMEVHGIAKVNHLNGDYEIDEDENGNAFPVDEYISESHEYIVSVRIAADNKSMARLVYTPKDKSTNCLPDNELEMKLNVR